MCTLMEKDVLIEDVSATAAFISNRFLEDSDLPKEFGTIPLKMER